MKQTAVEWLLENLISEPHFEKDFNYNSECWDKAKAMEKEQKNDLPVHFHEGVSNIWVFIEDGIIHVMPSPETFKSE